jgi:hypothetical protein
MILKESWNAFFESMETFCKDIVGLLHLASSAYPERLTPRWGRCNGTNA